MVARSYPWLGKSFGGLHICMDRAYAPRTIPRIGKDDDLLWSNKRLGTGRHSEIETKTDAAGWTRYFALVCSQVVMGGCHRCCSA